jgi:pimeloyl-ACP methyl ester carboxylesterase
LFDRSIARLLATTCLFLGCTQPRSNEPSKAQAVASAPDTLSRSRVTSIIANSRKIVSPDGVEQLLPLEINGARQWVSIRGRDRRNPILLLLHGGPGSPTMPNAYTFQSPWEDFFTVVEWDQRGAGKTYAANDPKVIGPTITLDQMANDADTLVEYLRRTYGKEKIFLLGHSWGTVLGVTLAQRHPERYYAYIGVGQIVDMRRSEKDGYEFALAEARSHHNDSAVRELQSIAPYPGPAGLLRARVDLQRKWLMYYGGLTWGRTDFTYDDEARALSPDYTRRDVDAIDSGSTLTLARLLPTLDTLSFEHTTTFRCPIFLFEGRHDYTTSNTLAADWFGRVTAPSKKLVWFANSAHMPMQEEPGRFLLHLVMDVRPLAGSSPSP